MFPNKLFKLFYFVAKSPRGFRGTAEVTPADHGGAASQDPDRTQKSTQELRDLVDRAQEHSRGANRQGLEAVKNELARYDALQRAYDKMINQGISAIAAAQQGVRGHTSGLSARMPRAPGARNAPPTGAQGALGKLKALANAIWGYAAGSNGADPQSGLGSFIERAAGRG